MVAGRSPHSFPFFLWKPTPEPQRSHAHFEQFFERNKLGKESLEGLLKSAKPVKQHFHQFTGRINALPNLEDNITYWAVSGRFGNYQKVARQGIMSAYKGVPDG